MTDLAGPQHALGDAASNSSALAGMLPGDLSQHTRLLRLHTPLGADTLLAERAMIEEGLMPASPHTSPAGWHIDLLALSARSDLTAASLLGQPMLLELLTSDGLIGAARRPFHGHVTRFARIDSDGGLTRYRLQIEPWLSWLGHRTDAWVFRNMSVLEITEAIFADYRGQAALEPVWRIDVANRATFAKRVVCTQFNETDLAFLTRLWAEAGLFAWFEHEGAAADAHLGRHTLVLANHNGAFQPNAQAHIRYTHADATSKEDALNQWHGVRRARLQRQDLEPALDLFEGAGNVRTLAPGTTFTLLDHPNHPPADGVAASAFVVLGVTHTARNNFEFNGCHPNDSANDRDAPIYEARLRAQPQEVPVRRPPADARGCIALSKPLVQGTQTAIVVGTGEPVHTDRDGRIKVQFHWQRGAQASHRMSHPAGDCNAAASPDSGTWVRVAQDWAGPHWGSVFVPRLGQEVVVAFLDGDIDQPVVIGATYNGQGHTNSPGNQVGAGAATATGNAPAWFTGDQKADSLEGHAHASTLSGWRSQSLESSQVGGGAHNQLVMDETPAQGRVLLHTTQAQTWLQIGHLLQQNGNQRLQARGHGLELHTQAQGALRAARGLHLSTHARQGGTSNHAQPLDTTEAKQQLRAHAELLQTLHTNAHAHKAKLPNEAAPEHLPARQAMASTLNSLKACEGGPGSIGITERADLLLSASANIASMTPASTVVETSAHVSLATNQDANLLAQRHQTWVVKEGISLFTRGETQDTPRQVQDVGLKLHAASGSVRIDARRGPLTLTAQKAVDLQSTAANIAITAPERIVLNGGGGYVKIEGGNIEIGTSGAAQFKATAKALTGGALAPRQPASKRRMTQRDIAPLSSKD